ncbi:myo-inositol 2-dehydrogenase / D-chiro-inositol 1-dehydrogenase [Anaerolineae bacterium]|nr:myo-inositol 2-dehydrogenase / D-chiro-inositol 1-dehydrogenase [Anaerolineae bacterium]
MSKLRIAVIGAGILGSRHARVFAEQPDAELVAVVDVNPARAEIAESFGAKFYADISTMLANENVDALAIATPDHLHRDPVIAALNAGKHVFVEKPLATTLADARELAAVSAKSKRVVMVNYSQRFVTDHLWIKRALDDGMIGKPQIVISVKFDTISVPTGMIRSWSAQTSPIFFMSSHDLDLTYWFLNRKPIEVFAHATRGTLDAQGIPVHDGLNALIQFDGGITTNFHSSWIHPNTYPRVADGYLQIIGSDGALMYNNRTRTVELFNSKGGQKVEFTGLHTADEVGGKITGAFTESVRHFITCIREQREPQTSPQNTLIVTETQAAVIESLKIGLPVKVTG